MVILLLLAFLVELVDPSSTSVRDFAHGRVGLTINSAPPVKNGESLLTPGTVSLIIEDAAEPEETPPEGGATSSTALAMYFPPSQWLPLSTALVGVVDSLHPGHMRSFEPHNHLERPPAA